jgi:hypothetical protein
MSETRDEGARRLIAGLHRRIDELETRLMKVDERRRGERFTVKCINKGTGLAASARFEAQLGQIRIRAHAGDAGTWQDVIFVDVPRYDGKGINSIPFSRDWFKAAQRAQRSDKTGDGSFPRLERDKGWAGHWDRPAGKRRSSRKAPPPARRRKGQSK